MATNIGPKIGIDGEAEYRKQIQQIIQETRTLKSEYEKLSSSTDKNSTSLKQNREMHRNLKEQIETQTRKIEEMRNMTAQAADKFGEADPKTLKWKETLNKAETELNNMQTTLRNLPSQLDLIGQKFTNVGEKIKSAGDKMQNWGQKLAPISAAATGALVGSAKAAIDFESAFTGVQKTVDATDEEFAQLSDWIKEASTQMASSKTDIAGVMEIAGQLGVSGVTELEEFTKTMIMLGDTTNLSSEEASSALAKFMNITGESKTDANKIGSAIVDLGNHFATTEADIVEMSTRLASAGTIAGLSSTDILALATSMSSVGINAEAGGTAMSQTLKQISKAVDGVGKGADENLKTIASVAGMSAEEFSAAWKGSPIDAIQAFIGGLGKLDEEDESVIATLNDLGMEGIRQSNMLQALALSSGILTDAVNTSNTAFEKGNALQDEAEKRYGTTESRLLQTKEKISNVAVELGDRLLPYVDKGIVLLDKVIAAWDKLDPDTQDMIVKAVALTAALAPVVSIGGKLVSGIGGLVSGIGMLASPVGLAIAAAAAVVAAGVLIYKNWDEIKAKAAELKEKVSFHLNALEEGAVIAWNNMKENASQKWDNIKTTVTTHAQAIKEGAKIAWDNMATNTKNKFNEIKNNITQPFKDAWDTVKQKIEDIWNKIKSLGERISGFHIEFPHIKMPHFNVSWKNYGNFSLPSLSVDWYAKAMDKGIRLTSPTIFGAAGGKLLGGGEVGNEWVIGENSLMQMIRSAVGNNGGSSVNIGDTTIVINASDSDTAEEIAERVDEIITSRLEALEAAWA